MRTDGQTIRANEMDVAKAMAWAKRTFSGERIALTVARLVVAAYVGVALAQVFHTY